MAKRKTAEEIDQENRKAFEEYVVFYNKELVYRVGQCLELGRIFRYHSEMGVDVDYDPGDCIFSFDFKDSPIISLPARVDLTEENYEDEYRKFKGYSGILSDFTTLARLIDSYYDFLVEEENRRENLRRTAIAKLTKEEIDALGVTE